MELKTEEHPSYGTIAFRRAYYGDSIPLFGSSIKHREVISLEITEAQLCRNYSEDSILPKNRIVRVEMSASQFAEAITSLNTTAVPCTITYKNGGGVEPCPYKSKRQQFEDEFSDIVEESKGEFKEFQNYMKELLDGKKNIGKGDREEILKRISVLEGKIFSNQEFVYTQFNRQMDKTVKEAKGEIEAFCQAKSIESSKHILELESE